MLATVGQNIKAMRLKRGLTQKELEEKTGIAAPNIGKYERGLQNPKIETLKKIAHSLGVSYLSLLSTNDEEHAFDELLFRKMHYESLNLIDEINYRLVPVGYSIHEILTEGHLWVNCPDDTSFEISLEEMSSLNNEIDSFVRFKLEELKNKHKDDTK